MQGEGTPQCMGAGDHVCLTKPRTPFPRIALGLAPLSPSSLGSHLTCAVIPSLTPVLKLQSYFSKENIKWHTSVWRTALIREIQIQETMEYNLTPVRMAINKKTKGNKCKWGCEEKRNFVYCCWKHKLIQPLYEAIWEFLKDLKIELSHDPVISLLHIYPKEMQSVCGTVIFTPVSPAELFTAAGCGNSRSVPQRMNGWRKCGMDT